MTVFTRYALLFLLCMSSCGQRQENRTEDVSGQSKSLLAAMEQQRKRSIRESLYPVAQEMFRQELQEYLDTVPRIGASEKAVIQPVIRKWLDYYGLDLSQAIPGGIYDYNIEEEPDKENLYYREFTEREDKSNLLTVDYSPDKMRYVNLGVLGYDGEDSEFGVWRDDCQQIYLIDRRLKLNDMICWLGVGSFADAVCWKDNNTFYLLGVTLGMYLTVEVEGELFDMSEPAFFIYAYDLAAHTKKEYHIYMDADLKEYEERHGYMVDITVPERTALLKANPGTYDFL